MSLVGRFFRAVRLIAAWPPEPGPRIAETESEADADFENGVQRPPAEGPMRSVYLRAWHMAEARAQAW